MRFRFRAVCQHVERNNGVTQALLTRPAVFSDPASQEEHVLLNIRSAHGFPEQGKEYWVDVAPAFPTSTEITTMPQTYQGQTVTDVRPARQGDQNFEKGKDQVVIRNADGSEQTVPRSEVKES